MKQCIVCHQHKKDEEFAFKNVSRAIRMSLCRKCSRDRYLKKYRENNKDKTKKAQQRYNEKNKELISLRRKVKRLENIESNRKRENDWASKRRENKNYALKQKEYRGINSEKLRLKRIELRMEVLEKYGNKCNCCGEIEKEFLSIDHIDGGGSKHRREIKHSIYGWLKSNKYPKGFQILCHNCNQAKGFYGICPHQK